MMCVGMRQVCHASSSVCGCCKCLSLLPPSLSLSPHLPLCLSPFAVGSFRFRALSQCSARASAAVAGLIFDYVISPSSKAPCRGIVRPIVSVDSTVLQGAKAQLYFHKEREREGEVKVQKMLYTNSVTAFDSPIWHYIVNRFDWNLWNYNYNLVVCLTSEFGEDIYEIE